jgi:phage gpG-like protein
VRFLLDAELDAGVDMLDAVRERFEDARPGLERVADDMRKYEKSVFSTRGGSRTRWKPTEEDKRRILVDTGGLLKSLTVEGAPNAVEKITADSVFIGTTHPAAIHHQRGRKGMPRRNPVPKPSPRRVKNWAQTFLSALIDD